MRYRCVFVFLRPAFEADQVASFTSRDDLPPALSNVSFSLPGGLKIGICGRFVASPFSLPLPQRSRPDFLLLFALEQDRIREVDYSSRSLQSYREPPRLWKDPHRWRRHIFRSARAASRLDEVRRVQSPSPLLVLKLTTTFFATLHHRHSRPFPLAWYDSREPRHRRTLLGRGDLESSSKRWNG